MKYVSSEVTFSEVPDEISLCIAISNCPGNCNGCHSPHLREDIGTTIDYRVLNELIEKNKGITCICFLGGDSTPLEVDRLALEAHLAGLKAAWYSGSDWVSPMINLENFDYIKVGRYREDMGPLTSRSTNQVMYKVEYLYGETGKEVELKDITYKFWNL